MNVTILVILIGIFIFLIWLIVFAEPISHNYYYEAQKNYEGLINIKNKYEYTKSYVLYKNFYEYKDKAYKHVCSLYIRDISLYNKIRIGYILKKITTMQLDIKLLNINKNEVNNDSKIER